MDTLEQEHYETMMGLGEPYEGSPNAFNRAEKLVITHELYPDKLSTGMRGLVTALRDLDGTVTGNRIAEGVPEYAEAVKLLNEGTLYERAFQKGYDFAERLRP